MFAPLYYSIGANMWLPCLDSIQSMYSLLAIPFQTAHMEYAYLLQVFPPKSGPMEEVCLFTFFVVYFFNQMFVYIVFCLLLQVSNPVALELTKLSISKYILKVLAKAELESKLLVLGA